MKRAAIYARFSTDRQNDRSVEDQVESCRALASREGLTVVSVFSDRARSGATMHGRDGIRAMLSAAAERTFDVLVCESTSRIGRDQEDRAGIHKRLKFAEISILTVTSGVITQLMDGVTAAMDSQQLADLKIMIRRGMAGNILEGKHNGGPPYGYRTIKGETGQLEIVESAADVVRSIYERFNAGEGPREIAGALNRDNVAPPRGGYWRASTLHGDVQRGFGILRNEIYIGRIIWNKTRKVLHPDTGKRIARLNTPDQWQRSEAPHLRIVSDDVFEAAAARLRGTGTARKPYKRSGRMLSGLLRCGACGAGMSMKDYDHGKPRIICTQHQQARTCANTRAYYLEPIERAVASGLREEFGTREALTHFIACYNDECRRIASGSTDMLERNRKALASIEAQIQRAVTSVVQNILTGAEAATLLPGMRAERDRLTAELAAHSATVIVLHKPAIDEYLAGLDGIEETINLGLRDAEPEVRAAMRGLVDTVTVMPSPAGKPPEIRVSGHLASLMPAGGRHEPDTRIEQTPRFSFTRRAA